MCLLPKDIKILPPSDDRVFKLLLTSPDAEPVLISLLSAILNQKVTSVSIRNNELPVSDTNEKSERFDINCVIDYGTQIDIEMQATSMFEQKKDDNSNIIGRSVYYVTDLHSSQKSKGIPYDELVKTYQITISSNTVFRNKDRYINTFSLRHDTDNDLLSDAIHIIYIELSKIEHLLKKSVSTMTDLEKWVIFFEHADNPEYRDMVNSIIESKEEMNLAGELLVSISQDEKEQAYLRSRRMFQSDFESNLLTAKRSGKEEGKEEERLKFIRNLLEINLPINDIVRISELTTDEVGRYIEIIRSNEVESSIE